ERIAAHRWRAERGRLPDTHFAFEQVRVRREDVAHEHRLAVRAIEDVGLVRRKRGPPRYRKCVRLELAVHAAHEQFEFRSDAARIAPVPQAPLVAEGAQPGGRRSGRAAEINLRIRRRSRRRAEEIRVWTRYR